MKLVVVKKNGYRGGSPFITARYGETVEMTDEDAKKALASDPGAFGKEGSAEAAEAVKAFEKASKKTHTKPAPVMEK